MVSAAVVRAAGSEPQDRKLLVNDGEARIVIDIYRRYRGKWKAEPGGATI